MGIQVPVLQRCMHYFAFMRVLSKKKKKRVNFIRVHLGTKVKIFLASVFLSLLEHNFYYGNHKLVNDKCLLFNCC